jgi:hypothetical protein
MNLNAAGANTWAYWDVDGTGGADFALFRGPGIGGTIPGRRLFLTSNNPNGDGQALNGQGFVVHTFATVPATANGKFFAAMGTVQTSQRVGPTLGSGLLWGRAGANNPTMTYRSLLVRNAAGTAAVPAQSAAVIGPKMQGFQAGNNYFGFRFLQGGNTLYGWGVLNLDLGGDGLGASATITEWAYNDVPNSSIHVPDVPEPSTAYLALIGLGAGGVRAWRSRKKARAEALAA